MNEHLISVIMSVYNVSIEYFKEAVHSIIMQSYKNWELIIINDGDMENDDKYRQCINNFNDLRIKYITNPVNHGISYCLNQAIDLAKGEFIAKMDGDDISLPNRFERQVKYFSRHKNIDVIGCKTISFGDSSELLIDFNNYTKKYRKALLFFRNSGIMHPSAMIRHQFLLDNKIKYNEHYKKALDYRLWVDCIKYSPIKTINSIELKYRRHKTQISTAGKKEQDLYRDEVRLMQLEKLGIIPNNDEIKLHLDICNRNIDILHLDGYDLWIKKILDANKKTKYLSQWILKGMLYSELIILIFKRKKNFKIKYLKYICLESLLNLIFATYIRCYNKLNILWYRRKKLKD